MNNSNRIIFGAKRVHVLLLGILLITLYACSDSRPDSPPPGMGPGMRPGMGHGDGPSRKMKIFRKHPPELFLFGDVTQLKKKLGLTDEQIERISAINSRYQKIHYDLWNDAAPLRKELMDEMLAENIDRGKIRSILVRLSENDVDRQMAIVEQRIEIEKELTPDQLSKIMRKNRH